VANAAPFFCTDRPSRFNGPLYSLGISLAPDGSLGSVMWESPAFKIAAALDENFDAVFSYDAKGG
jgi:hypothetical protein